MRGGVGAAVRAVMPWVSRTGGPPQACVSSEGLQVHAAQQHMAFASEHVQAHALVVACYATAAYLSSTASHCMYTFLCKEACTVTAQQLLLIAAPISRCYGHPRGAFCGQKRLELRHCLYMHELMFNL